MKMQPMQKGAFMRGLDHMIIKEIPTPSAGAGKVVVSLEYVGICGSWSISVSVVRMFTISTAAGSAIIS